LKRSLTIEAMTEEGLAAGIGNFGISAPSREQWNASRLPHSNLVARDQHYPNVRVTPE
jgi:hypothetical protein